MPGAPVACAQPPPELEPAIDTHLPVLVSQVVPGTQSLVVRQIDGHAPPLHRRGAQLWVCPAASMTAVPSSEQRVAFGAHFDSTQEYPSAHALSSAQVARQATPAASQR